jgi:thymidylate synthase
MLNIVSIKATTIPDAWHQLIMSIMDNGKVFKIDEGSYSGDYRLEFDFVIIQILHPEIRPFEPELPDDMKNAGIPNPVAPGYIEGGEGFEGDPYVLYLMSSEKKSEEDYTYGQRLNRANPVDPDKYEHYIKRCNFDQVQYVIDKYKTGKIRNNQLCMSIAQPGDMLLKDPPCLQLIDTRIQDGKLHFTTYFRSWDLWGGLPANFGGIQCLKEHMAEQIGVDPGETIGVSKGLHIYSYVWELAELRRRKTGYVSKFLQEIQSNNPTCGCCGAKMLRFGWYEIDPLYKYWYCLECDKANRLPFLRAQYNGIWMD